MWLTSLNTLYVILLGLFGPPQITEFGNTSSTSIYIKWQPPNSTILYTLLGYRIFYKESNDTSLTMLVQAVEKTVREVEITDLKFYTNYSVRVCAFSPAGNGVPTITHHMMTDEYGKSFLLLHQTWVTYLPNICTKFLFSSYGSTSDICP